MAQSYGDSVDPRTANGRGVPAPTKPLTEIERKILDFMVHYLRENTYQPSIREIGRRFGIKSTKTVSEHLQALEAKGYLKRDPSRSRGVRILGVDLSPAAVSVPCYRTVPDGREGGVEAAEMYLAVDRRIAGPKGCFFLRARGDALAAFGIEHGDLLLVEPIGAETLEDGSLVAAGGREGVELLRCRRVDGELSFRTARGAETLAEEVRVVGRVTALFRRLDGQVGPASPTAH